MSQSDLPIKDAMPPSFPVAPFEMGTYLVVPGHGVGQFLGVEQRIHQASGQQLCYYVLKMISTGAKIMIPMSGPGAIRSLVSSSEVDEVLGLIGKKDEARYNRESWNRRQREYMAKINTGSLREIASVLREILVMRMTKKLSYSEKKVLDLCKELLVKEMALTTGEQESRFAQQIEAIYEMQALAATAMATPH